MASYRASGTLAVQLLDQEPLDELQQLGKQPVGGDHIAALGLPAPSQLPGQQESNVL
jgi:hypothetical protein